MPFINEYVCDEDVDKYNLNELWFKYNPGKTELLPGYQHQWTVDHDENVFLKVMKTGREELSNRVTFILYFNGYYYQVDMDVANGGSLKFSEQPYIQIWEFVRISPKPANEKYKSVIAVLKDALIAYGVRGITFQVPNTVVKFNNI